MKKECLERLIYLKKRSNYTWKEIALELRVSRQSISRWINGSNKPTVENCLFINDWCKKVENKI